MAQKPPKGKPQPRADKAKPPRPKPRPPKVTLTSIKQRAKRAWAEAGVLTGGRTHIAASTLAERLGTAIKANSNFRLFTRERGTNDDDEGLEYLLTRSPNRPAGKKWDTLIALADIIAPEPPYNTDTELWTQAIHQGLATSADVPSDYRQLVYNAIHGTPPTHEKEEHPKGSEPGSLTQPLVDLNATNPCGEEPTPRQVQSLIDHVTTSPATFHTADQVGTAAESAPPPAAGATQGGCNCGADRTGPSAEAHDEGCPERPKTLEPVQEPEWHESYDSGQGG